MERSEVIKRCELFEELNGEQIVVLAGMCEACEFEPGAIICKQGAEEDYIYVIENGLVGIFVETGPLSERQVQAASNFDVFGWSAMIEPYTCTATVKALEKTRALAFKGKALCDMCLERPDIGCRVCRRVARIVSDRLRQSFTQLLGVTYQD